MSNLLDDGAHVTSARGVANTVLNAQRELPARQQPQREVAAPAVEITLSPEAKTALETLRSETSERAERARQGAKEIAAAAGVSESKAVHIAQPLRSPPPAKGAALFQANIVAEGSQKPSS